MITLREIIDHIDSGEPFSCKVVSYDEKRKKGGSIIEYDELRVLRPEEALKEQKGRPKTETEKLKAELYNIKRNPHHKKHFTRNCRIYQQGHPVSLIRKIHVALIIEFNGEKDIAV